MLAEPAHEARQQPARNAIGQQEIESPRARSAGRSRSALSCFCSLSRIHSVAMDSQTLTYLIAGAGAAGAAAAIARARRRLQLSRRQAPLAGRPCPHVAPARRAHAVLRVRRGPLLLLRRRARTRSPRAGATASSAWRATIEQRFANTIALNGRGQGRHLGPAVHRRLPRAVPVQPPRARAPGRRLVARSPRRRHADRPRRQPASTTWPAPTASTCSATTSTRTASSAARRASRDLGPVLGAYHPVVAYNVKRLREISGLDEVSFHMSGTEAVMQAVRLARYHTRPLRIWCASAAPTTAGGATCSRASAIRCPPRETYTLADMSRGHAARAARPAATSPACSSIRCRPCIPTRRRRATRRWSTARAAPASTARPTRPGSRQLRAVCSRARHRAHLRRGVRRLPARAGRRAGVLRRARRPGHLRQDARRRPAGRRGLRPPAT